MSHNQEQYRRFRQLCLTMLELPIGMPVHTDLETLISSLHLKLQARMAREKEELQPRIESYTKDLVRQNTNLTKGGTL